MSELFREREEINLFDKKIIRTNKIKQIHNVYNELIRLKKVILVLDIDDVVLSTNPFQLWTEQNICDLVTQAFYINKNNLVFLTSRLKQFRKYTLNQFNTNKLVDSDEYINYNIICAELDHLGEPTKGPRLKNYLIENYDLDQDTWVIFVDDLTENIISVKKSLEQININYTLFHYC